MTKYLTLLFVVMISVSCAAAPGDFPTEVKADYGLPARKLTPADMRLGENEAMVIDFHQGDRKANLPEYLKRYDEKLLRWAAQGMINRSGPYFWLDYTAIGLKDGDPVWLKYYSEARGYKFSRRPYETGAFIRELAPLFNGIILYEAEPSDNYFLAANLASINFCLPVSRWLYDTYRPDFGDLPVIAYIEKNRFTRAQVYDFLLKECLPLMDRKAAMSLDVRFPDNLMGPSEWDEYNMGGLDYAFYRNMLLFNVSGLQAHTTSVYGGPNATGYMNGSPEDAAIFERIMRSYEPSALIFGWNNAEAIFTHWGHRMLHNIWMSSGSFHAAVKPLHALPYLQDDKPRIDKPEQKVYLAFVSNEGDTISHTSLFHWGAWQKPERGQVPLNWSINPAYVEMFPSLFEYFWSTKSPNDYFVCGPSGGGYVHLDFMPAAQTRLFARETARLFREAVNLREIILWQSHRLDRMQTLVEEIPQLRALHPKYYGINYFGRLWHIEGGKHQVPVLQGETAMSQYWNAYNAMVEEKDGRRVPTKNMLDHLEEVWRTMPKPAYIIFYGLQGDEPHAVLELSKKLDSQRFQVIDMGTMAHLAGQTPSNLSRVPVDPTRPPGAIDWKPELLDQPERWTVFEQARIGRAPGGGLRVSAAAEEGKSNLGWALLENVVLPRDAGWIRFNIPEITGGNVDFKMEGVRFEGGKTGFGYAPVGQPPYLGEYLISISPEMRKKIRAGEPIPRLMLGINGSPTGSVVYDKMEFLTDEQVGFRYPVVEQPDEKR